MKEALKVCTEILKYEPRNKMLLEYKKSLTEYVAQGINYCNGLKCVFDHTLIRQDLMRSLLKHLRMKRRRKRKKILMHNLVKMKQTNTVLLPTVHNEHL